MSYENKDFRDERIKSRLFKLRTDIIDMEQGSEEFNDTWDLIKLLEAVEGLDSEINIEDAYNEGYDMGYSEGYDAGYSDGADYAEER